MQNLKKFENRRFLLKTGRGFLEIVDSGQIVKSIVWIAAEGQESVVLSMRHLRSVCFKGTVKHPAPTDHNVKPTLANGEYRFSETQGIRKENDVKKQVHAGKGIYKMLQA